MLAPLLSLSCASLLFVAPTLALASSRLPWTEYASRTEYDPNELFARQRAEWNLDSDLRWLQNRCSISEGGQATVFRSITNCFFSGANYQCTASGQVSCQFPSF